MVFWVKRMNLDMGLAAYPSIYLGLTVEWRKISPSTSDSHGGPEDIHCLFYSFERDTLILSVPLLGELSWPFLLTPNGSWLTPINHLSGSEKIANLIFMSAASAWDPLKKESILLWAVGCLFCSSLLIWLSWKCMLSGRDWFGTV